MSVREGKNGKDGRGRVDGRWKRGIRRAMTYGGWKKKRGGKKEECTRWMEDKAKYEEEKKSA